MDEEKRFTICYATEDGDTTNIWLYASDPDDAVEKLNQEYWDVDSVISVSEM